MKAPSILRKEKIPKTEEITPIIVQKSINTNLQNNKPKSFIVTYLLKNNTSNTTRFTKLKVKSFFPPAKIAHCFFSPTLKSIKA